MSGRKFGYFSMLRAMSWRQVCLCALFCLMLLTLIGLNLYELMRLGTESAYRNCENSYLLASRELGEYLRVADKAIDSASRRIEEMRDGGATPEELLAYMTRETGNLDSLIAGPTTGVYGYIDGVYLDGTGWTPQEGYDPTQRPWYLGATRAYGNVTHIPPFDNMQTGSTTITVCKMLSDWESVVAIDLPTDNLQNIVDNIIGTDVYSSHMGGTVYSYAQIIVIDEDGTIIAHSDRSEVGKNCITSENASMREFADQAIVWDKTFFRIEGDGRTLLYCGGKLDDWYIFSGLEYSEVTGRITRNLVISIAVGILGVLGIIAVASGLSLQHYLAETDRMTGVHNRSGETKVGKMLAAGRGGLFLLMDVDKFKRVNDTFGHEVGDKVLIAIANAMRASFRKQDVIMRLGGDEFAVYVPGVYDEATAEPIIKRLFDRIYEDSPPELGERKISVSVGATFYRDNDRFSFSDLYKKADAGTYESKAFATSHVTFCR